MRKLKTCRRTLVLVALGVMTPTLTFAQTQERTLGIPKVAVHKFEPPPKVLKFPEPKPDTAKIGFLYKASNVYFLGATALDTSSTALSMGHPTLASRTDGSVLTRYYGVETGWAKQFGARNTGAAVAANVALNAGLGFLSYKLYQRGGHWRILAIGINVLKGTDNLMAGIHNIRSNAGVDARVRSVTGYKGQIIWSH